MGASYSFSGSLTGLVQQDRAAKNLHDRVERLFLEGREDVYRYLMGLGLYPPQAQEAAQEVFLRLYVTLRKGEEIDNPRAWIFRVAHNLGLKLRAREGSRAPFDPDLAAQLKSASPDPETSVLDRERSVRFHTAVGQLSEQQRRCLFLRLEGLRYPEIGATLGISASTVGEFLRRAIKQLRKGEL